MKALKLYLTALGRYRRSRGFGVHSPFAYYFIVRVLREKYGYYAYRGIDRVARMSGGMKRSEARCLFRVANYFAPRVMLVAGGDDSCAAAGVLRTVSSEAVVVTVATGPVTPEVVPELIYVERADIFGSAMPESLLVDCLRRGGTVVIGGMARGNAARRLFHSVDSAMTCGMTFSNGRTAVMTGREGLPRQRFSLWF